MFFWNSLAFSMIGSHISPYLMSLMVIINTCGGYISTDKISNVVVASKVVRTLADHQWGCDSQVRKWK